MTDACIICETEAVCLDEWYVKFTMSHGQMAIIECVCPWCAEDMYEIRKRVLKSK